MDLTGNEPSAKGAGRVRAGKFHAGFFVLDLIAAAITLARKPDGFMRVNVAEELLASVVLFSIGFSYFYNFVFTSSSATWLRDSPRQPRLAAIGFLGFKNNCAAVVQGMDRCIVQRFRRGLLSRSRVLSADPNLRKETGR